MIPQPLTKEQVIKAIQAMPQNEFTSVDEVIEEILLLVKTNEGLSAIAGGATTSADELNKK